jgi:hypothetical protein
MYTGEWKEKESKESARLDMNHGFPRQYHESKPGPIDLHRAPSIARGDGKRGERISMWCHLTCTIVNIV